MKPENSSLLELLTKKVVTCLRLPINIGRRKESIHKVFLVIIDRTEHKKEK